MDRELQRARRRDGDGPGDLRRRAALLLRAGDVVAAAAVLRPALCGGEALPADLHDAFAPPSLEGLGFVVRPGQVEHALGPTAWVPGGRVLVAAQNDVAAPDLLRWDAGAEQPRRLRALGRWAFTRGLTVSPDGERVALHVRRDRRSAWELCRVRDGRVLSEASSPEPRSELGRWQHSWWQEHVLCATDRGELWAWDLHRTPRPLWKAPELELADGTILARRKRELCFYATPYAAEPRAVIPLPHQARLNQHWSGMLAVAGQRALVVDREHARITLWSAGGDALGEAPLPDFGTHKLVAVRACPAGSVVALRFQAQRRLALVDLRDGAHAWFTAPQRPRDLVWSPCGQRLALPSRQGTLTVLGPLGA